MLLGPSLLTRILELTRWQMLLAIVVMSGAAWLVEVVMRRRWNASRRRLLASQLRVLRNSLAFGGVLWLGVQALLVFDAPSWGVVGVGFVAIAVWLHVGLRVARVFVLEWLFASSEREGVPLLLVDIFSLVASAILFCVLLHTVFLIEVTSLLATSAVVSVVLGLALQDTLGQLFAGISLQLDRPFRLGDWVEVRTGSERINGQVLEVSWRATLLLALGEELVTIPNKTMAQGLVLNFSGRERPFVRSHLFRVPLDTDVALVKRLLVQAALETKGVMSDPRPLPLLIETTESWIAIKMVNFVSDYGNQYSIGDAYQTRALELLAQSGIQLAAPRLQVLHSEPSASPLHRSAPGTADADDGILAGAAESAASSDRSNAG